MRANRTRRWKPIRLAHLGAAVVTAALMILSMLPVGSVVTAVAPPTASPVAQALASTPPLPSATKLPTQTATATVTQTLTPRPGSGARPGSAATPVGGAQQGGTPTLAPTRTATLALATATRTPTTRPTSSSTATPTRTPTGIATTPAVVIAQSHTATVTSTPTIPPTSTPTPTETATFSLSSLNRCDPRDDPALGPDGFEPDNTRGEANLIDLGVSQTHNLCSATNSPDEDWVQFPVETAGEYTITTFNLSEQTDTLLEVQGPEGFNAQNDDGGSTPLGSEIIFTPTANGIAFARVRQSSKRPFLRENQSEPRDYDIVVVRRPARTPTPTETPAPATTTPTATPSPCQDEFEFDNDPEDATALFVNNPRRHVLCGDGDVDWVHFDAVAGKPYRIFTSDLAPGVDTLIVLYGPDWAELLEINDDYPGRGLASQINLTSPVTTRYYAKIQDSTGHGDKDFSYILHLESDGLPNGGPCPDQFEFDGTADTATEILLGASQEHSFCPEGDADFLSFFALAGKSYTVATSNLTVGTDTLLTIFSDASTDIIIAQDDDSGGGLASRADFIAPFDGIYYAQLKNAGDIGGPGQRYTVTFSSGGAVPAQATPTPGATTGPGTPTPVGTRITPAAVGPPGDAGLRIAGLDSMPEPAVQVAALPMAAQFADTSFAATWARADEPVRQELVARGWTWGPGPGPSHYETYKGAPGGERLVQYFDKARMEITHPEHNPANAWYVTNGLLAKELISGLLQQGDSTTEQRKPSQMAIVGDGDARAPSYADFRTIASLDNDRRVPERRGKLVTESIDGVGKVRTETTVAASVTNWYYVPETGHNIPDVFWGYMTQRGQVYTGEAFVDGTVTDWVAAFGLPITEAYWTRAIVAGVDRSVLVQVFERRVLSFTPENAARWQVEMGNAGEHYYRWRYGGRF